MKLLEKIFRDLREGENLEVYLTLVVALALLILDVFGVASAKAVAAGTLATLALLAYSTLKDREQVQRLTEATEQGITSRLGADDFFWQEYRLGEEDFAEADFIGVVGVTLSRTVKNLMNAFEDRLMSKAHIRLMVIDPESRAPGQAILRSKSGPSISFYHNLLRPTIERICILASRTNLPGRMELGLLPYIPCFGLVLIDPDQPHGRIIVEMYLHKKLAFAPTFELNNTREDARWYNFFRDQFDLLWQSCENRQAAGGKIAEFKLPRDSREQDTGILTSDSLGLVTLRRNDHVLRFPEKRKSL